MYDNTSYQRMGNHIYVVRTLGCRDRATEENYRVSIPIEEVDKETGVIRPLPLKGKGSVNRRLLKILEERDRMKDNRISELEKENKQLRRMYSVIRETIKVIDEE